MTTPAPLAEHPEIRSAIDLLEAWVEARRVAHALPGISLGVVHEADRDLRGPVMVSSDARQIFPGGSA